MQELEEITRHKPSYSKGYLFMCDEPNCGISLFVPVLKLYDAEKNLERDEYWKVKYARTGEKYYFCDVCINAGLDVV